MQDTQIPKYRGIHTVIRTNDGMAVQQEDKIHTLNYTASEIYELCDGKRTVEGIFQEMHLRYPDDDIDPLVKDFFSKLIDSGLIDLN